MTGETRPRGRIADSDIETSTQPRVPTVLQRLPTLPTAALPEAIHADARPPQYRGLTQSSIDQTLLGCRLERVHPEHP